MRPLKSVLICILLDTYVYLSAGNTLRPARSAPCIRSACSQGPGITERRDLVNGLKALKKLLLTKQMYQISYREYSAPGFIGTIEQYNILIRQLRSSNDVYASNTKFSIYAAVFEQVIIAACNYVNTLVDVQYRINCTDPVEASLVATSLGLLQGVTNTERLLPSVDCLNDCQWIRNNVPEGLSSLAANLTQCL